MRDLRDNLLHMMRDEDQRRPALLGGEPSEGPKETFAGDGIKSGARFVEDQHPGIRHEGAGDEHLLALALAEHPPRTSREASDTHPRETAFRLGRVGGRPPAPIAELRGFAAQDGVHGGFLGGHLTRESAAHHADVPAKFLPVGGAVALSQHLDLAVRGCEVGHDGRQQGGLPRAVGAEDRPMLAPADTPCHLRQDARGPAQDPEAADGKQGDRGAER